MNTKINYIKLILFLALPAIAIIYNFFPTTKEANIAGFYDVRYYVEYSPDPSFSYISNRYEFYNRFRDEYYLKPEQIDIKHWITKGPGLYGSKDQRFARIKGSINDSTFNITEGKEFMGCILYFDHGSRNPFIKQQ